MAAHRPTHIPPLLPVQVRLLDFMGMSYPTMDGLGLARQLARFKEFFTRLTAADVPNLPNNSFVGGRILGDGGDGIAALWLRRDATDRITQRIVIKVIKLDQNTWDRTIDHYRLWDHVNGRVEPAPGTPMEAYCQNICVQQPATLQDNILCLFSQRTQGAPYYWRRFYMEYAPHGTLLDLVAKYRVKKATRRVYGRRRYRENVPIPEAFLWACFEGLAKAAIAMETPPSLGTVGRPIGHPTEAWGQEGGVNGTEVVHKDLKLSNVLLGDNNPGHFPMYPNIKIGDFGKARLTDPQEPYDINPLKHLWDGCTEGWEPPELDFGPYNFAHQPPAFGQLPDPAVGLPQANVRALAYTNIWQIGMIMRSLMRNDDEGNVYTNRINRYAIPRMTAAGTEAWEPQMNDGFRMDYSADLVNVVQNCLHIDPAQRIDPRGLLTAIHNRWHVHGLDAAGTRLHHMSRHRLDRLDKADEYAVGMAIGNFP